MEFVINRSEEHLAHHGIKGQKWGVRRYQNEDGTYTNAGKERYGKPDRQTEKLMKKMTKISKMDLRDKYSALEKLSTNKKFQKTIDDDNLKSKREAYKKAHKEWYQLSKGDDFDAYDDETGYENYGITPKEFRKIMKLDAKRTEAQSKVIQETQKKARDFVQNYVDQPSSKIKLTDEERKDIANLLGVAAMKFK